MSATALCLLAGLTGTLAARVALSPRLQQEYFASSLNGAALPTGRIRNVDTSKAAKATEYTSNVKSRMTMGGHARKLAQASQPAPPRAEPTPMHFQRANGTIKHHMDPHTTWKNLTAPHTHHVCIPKKLQVAVSKGKAAKSLIV